MEGEKQMDNGFEHLEGKMVQVHNILDASLKPKKITKIFSAEIDQKYLVMDMKTWYEYWWVFGYKLTEIQVLTLFQYKTNFGWMRLLDIVIF